MMLICTPKIRINSLFSSSILNCDRLWRYIIISIQHCDHLSLNRWVWIAGISIVIAYKIILQSRTMSRRNWLLMRIYHIPQLIRFSPYMLFTIVMIHCMAYWLLFNSTSFRRIPSLLLHLVVIRVMVMTVSSI